MKKIILGLLLLSSITLAKGENIFGFKYTNHEILLDNEVSKITSKETFKTDKKFNGLMTFNIENKKILLSKFNQLKSEVFDELIKGMVNDNTKIINYDDDFVSLFNAKQNTRVVIFKDKNKMICISWVGRNNLDNLINYLKYNHENKNLKILHSAQLDFDRYDMNNSLDKLKKYTNN